MPDLIAQGVEAQQRWRRSLPTGQMVVLGRAAGVWAVPWDQHVSRKHVSMCFDAGRLEVVRLPDASNPVYCHGKEEDRFSLAPGEHFVIGQTTFTLTDQRVSVAADLPEPLQEQAFSSSYLEGVRFRNPDHRIEVLSRLPQVISGAAGETELFVRLVSMLLAGVPRAAAAAVVALREEGDGEDRAEPASVLHWDQRLLIGDDFQPSRGLIQESIRRRQSVLHVWRGSKSAAGEQFTESENFDWAFCTPVLGSTGTGAETGWGLYLAGRFSSEAATGSSDPTDLREDVKFTELVGATLASLRQMRMLEHRQATLSQFFSPVVLDTLAVEDPDIVLAPRETEVSVMFCDLRGFSRETERHGDDLLGLLERVSKALGVMTHHIRHQGGVVGDFQGDAAMGFWGWPLKQEDAVRRTCRAALAIRNEFEQTADFHAGIGIATGKAVAGKIGTVDQVKVTVFGPVVNLASRLEGMTKTLRGAILLDEATAAAVSREVPPDVARLRRLARIRPFGMDAAVEVSELLPPLSELPSMTDEHVSRYEAALDAFASGDWSEALELLHGIPAEDRVKDFLTVHIVQHDRTPPPGWDGVVSLGSK